MKNFWKLCYLCVLTVLYQIGFTEIIMNEGKQTPRDRDVDMIGIEHLVTESKDKVRSPNENNQFVSCPRKCKCSNLSETVNVFVNCSFSNLDKIPVFPGNTVKLLLNNNQIVEVNAYIFKNLNDVVYIDLSYNTIKRLDNNSLYGLSSLEYLSLSNNILSSVDSFPVHVFKPLHRIKELHLQGNCDSQTMQGCIYHDLAIAAAVNVEVLYIDGIPRTDLGQGFRALKHLAELRMGKGYCKLEILTKNTFVNVISKSLHLLDLTNCHIHTTETYTFSCLKFMKTLIMTNNDKLCANGLKNVFIGLNETRIDSLIMKHICNDVAINLDVSVSLPLSNTSLRHLDLERSKIEYISPMTIVFLPKTIKFFSLKENIINDVNFLLAMPFMQGLEYLDGSCQNRYTLNSLSKIYNIKTGGANVLNRNSPNILNSAKELNKATGLSDKRMKPYNNYTRIPWPDPVPLPPKLRYVNASFLKMPEYSIVAVNFNPNNSLENVDMSSDMLKSFEGKVTGLHNLKCLNLSGNNIRYIYPEAFGDFPELKTLKLGDNKIGLSGWDIAYEGVFSKVTKLEYLNLFSNYIKTLPVNIFGSLINLKELDLNDNSFNEITFRLNGLVSLQNLVLSNNQIKYLSSTTTADLDIISKGQGQNLKLNLIGNPLQCFCEHQDFVKWLLKTEVQIQNKETTFCTLKNGTKVRISDLHEIEPLLGIQCMTWAFLTSCIVGFAFLLTVLSCVAVLYNQRWKLRYLYYIGRRNINPYHPIQQDNIDLKCDAYLSFDEGHLLQNGDTLYDFVSKKLYQALQRSGLNIKIRHELHSGKLMHDVLSSAIRHSNKVVVFLSAEYCNEFWNTFEFNMAAYEGLYTKRSLIIQVLVGDVRPRDLLPEIRAYVTNNHVIAFPSEENFEGFVDELVRKIIQ